MRQDVREYLLGCNEEKYQKFSQNLIPGVDNIIGIRLPILRAYAKELAKGDWEQAMDGDDLYFEETMLRGMLISYAIKDIKKALPYIEDFIPRVDNWSICDSVFMTMNVLQKDREMTWEFIRPYLYSGEEFKVRVALVIMMQHLLKCDEHGKKMSRKREINLGDMTNENEISGQFLERILEALNREFYEGYYASMAASWELAECFCLFPYHTVKWLGNCSLDAQTRNKGIQKIIESRIPSDEVKRQVRKYKLGVDKEIG